MSVLTCGACGKPIDILPFDEKGGGAAYVDRQVDGRTVAYHLTCAYLEDEA